MEKKLKQKILQVIIEKSEFQKPNYYFLTLQFGDDPDKKRTDISPAVTQPQFLANEFDFELQNQTIEKGEILKFEAFTAGHGNDSKLQGECEIDVGSLNLEDFVVQKQRLKFTRLENYKNHVIGQFICSFQIKADIQAKDVGDGKRKFEITKDFTYGPTEVELGSHQNNLQQSQDPLKLQQGINPNMRQFNDLTKYHLNLDENGQPIFDENGESIPQKQKIKRYNTLGETIQSEEGGEDINLIDQQQQQDEEDKVTTISDILGENLSGIKNQFDKWQILSKELSQKQEILHRMQREIDEKQNGIKETGQEIVDLRKQLKLIETQHTILKKRVHAEEQLKLHTVVTPDVQKMKIEELTTRILNVATAYRDEKKRNEDFEQAMKEAEKDIQKISHLEQELETLRNKHEKGSHKLTNMQTEISQKQFYQDAVDKQTQVISKLEGLMESVLLDAEAAKKAQVELRLLQKDVNELTTKLKTQIYSDQRSNVENLRYENSKLENILKLLKEEVEQKTPKKDELDEDIYAKWAGSNEELYVRHQRSQARVLALQEEIQDNAKKYAQEFSLIKLEIAQKQAQLDALTVDVVYNK